MWQRPRAASQNLLPDSCTVEKVRLFHYCSALSSTRQKEKVCVFKTSVPSLGLCSPGFLITRWRESWLEGCSLTDGRIRKGLEVATLIRGVNPLPTPVIGGAIPAGRSKMGGDDHWLQNHMDETVRDHSLTSQARSGKSNLMTQR